MDGAVGGSFQGAWLSIQKEDATKPGLAGHAKAQKSPVKEGILGVCGGLPAAWAVGLLPPCPSSRPQEEVPGCGLAEDPGLLGARFLRQPQGIAKKGSGSPRASNITSLLLVPNQAALGPRSL